MSVTYAHRWKHPYLIVKGVATALTADIYLSSSNAQQTASAGTIDIYRGSTSVISSAAATGLGPPATYTVTAGTTSALTVDPTERWRVIWTLTISGTAYKFADRPAFLVDYDIWPQIIDTDLTDEAPELARMLGSTLTTFQTQREAAWGKLFRDLYARSIHPQQVTDGGFMREAHLYLTVSDCYRQAANALSDATLRDKANDYRQMYMDALLKPFDYDGDADGFADDKGGRTTPITSDPYAERPRVG